MSGHNLSVIRRCATSKHMIKISYTDSKNNTTSRMVEPYEIRGDSLYAFDVTKGAIRNFKLGNIIGAEDSNIGYTPRFPIVIN